MELGIIGLPTSGKTTIFNTLTKSDRPTSAASTGMLELFSLIVPVPDPRVDRLAKLYQPQKTTYAKVTYTDIAGLDKDLGTTGLSGRLRNKIAPMDALVHIVRAFENARVPHPLGSVDPQRDLDSLDSEFLLADLITVENRLERINEEMAKGASGRERQALEAEKKHFQHLRATLEEGIPLRDLGLTTDEKADLRGYSLLTLKPTIVLLNIGDEAVAPEELVTYDHQETTIIAIRGQLEMEISQLEPEEAAIFKEEFEIETLARERVLQASASLVGRLTFFTVSEEEVRAWLLPVGATAVEAAYTIHTDLGRGFIRAEVISYDKLLQAGGLAEARHAGETHIEGKDYIVQEGDVLQIRFSG
jgi:hypothetical protein